MNLIEGDLYKTKDDKLVMIHDNNLKRLCGNNLQIENLNYDDLPSFQKNILIHFSDDKYYSNDDNINHKPDLFEDFLKEYQNSNIYFCIEVKSKNDKDILQAVNLVKKYKMENQICIGVANKSLNSFKKKNGNFITFMPVFSLLKVYIFFLFGILNNIKEF